MMAGRDVVIGRYVIMIGLVSVIFAIMVGYATVHAERSCGETVAQVIDVDAATASRMRTKAFE